MVLTHEDNPPDQVDKGVIVSSQHRAILLCMRILTISLMSGCSLWSQDWL